MLPLSQELVDILTNRIELLEDKAAAQAKEIDRLQHVIREMSLDNNNVHNELNKLIYKQNGDINNFSVKPKK